jgi:hypothetical protein
VGDELQAFREQALLNASMGRRTATGTQQQAITLDTM